MPANACGSGSNRIVISVTTVVECGEHMRQRACTLCQCALPPAASLFSVVDITGLQEERYCSVRDAHACMPI